MNYLPVKSFVTHEMWRLREGMNKDDTEGYGQRDCLGDDGIIQNGRGDRRKASWLGKEQCASFGTPEVGGALEVQE